MNTLKTTILMATLTGLFIVVGGSVGGQQGMVIAFGLALVMNGASYWFSDRIALMMHHAQELPPAQAPELHRMIERLCQRANLPMPRVYMIPDESMNAFATGRNPQHSAVAFTAGILDRLSLVELEGVAAHELGHIKHRDVLISTIAAVMAGAITMIASLARWAMIFGGGGRSDDDREGGNPLAAILLIVLAPIAALVIQMAVSRSREYAADAAAAGFCGSGSGLVSALRKLERGAQVIPTNANPATAHMFIISPLRGGALLSLFSTHPPVEERIKRLEALAG